uniref:Kinesin-like protein n=1 Tax=Cacopsylla melanoneura TaxID=428564 RepID=A0A8D8RDN3_9HEMI
MIPNKKDEDEAPPVIKQEYKKKKQQNESVQVVVRCRPMNTQEIQGGYEKVVDMWSNRGVIEISNPKEDVKEPKKIFTFDAVYDWNSKQSELYDDMVRPLVCSVLEGFNGTIFAYGQTGTGKTYTMEGSKDLSESKGVIPNSFDQIFSHISRTENKQYLIRSSYLEIYQEEIRDLLDKDQTKRYELRENPDSGVYVKNLQSYICKNVKEIEQVMQSGNHNRTIGATNMNEHSSRSHAIFIITIEMSDVRDDNTMSQVRVGKLNLVDLAGSERQSKTGATGKRLKEASKINLSLSALGNVISALVDGKNIHVPYRDSKLTRLLQDSLGGNSKTLMIANIGPASYNYEESLTTLRYANRAKNIKNQPRVNEDPKEALLREYQEEIQRLKNMLNQRSVQTPSKLNDDSQTREEYLNEEQDKLNNKRKRIMNENHLSEAEKTKLLLEVENKQKTIAEEKKYTEELANRINSMESKLLQGGKNIIDHTNEQQKALEKQKSEISERKRRMIEMKQELDKKEESTEEIRGNYSTLEQEVQAKNKKLQKIYSKYEEVKQDIQDIMDEFNRDRRDLEQSQDDMLRDLKLRKLIIENFIPIEELKRLEQRLVYDEELTQWNIVPETNPFHIQKRLVASAQLRRPTTLKAQDKVKQSTMDAGKLRYVGENIITLNFDMCPNNCKNYQGPKVAPSILSVLQAALQDEADIDVDVKSSSNKKMNRTNKAPLYPKPRGLVPK